MRPQYEKKAKELGINDKVEFLRKLDDKKLSLCYDNCYCLVLPSINKCEAFGLVLLEAMASAKPVIASRLAGVSQVFEDGNQGFFVKPKDANDLADKLKILLKNAKLAKDLGDSGRKLVQEKYSWEEVVKRIERIYL